MVRNFLNLTSSLLLLILFSCCTAREPTEPTLPLGGWVFEDKGELQYACETADGGIVACGAVTSVETWIETGVCSDGDGGLIIAGRTVRTRGEMECSRELLETGIRYGRENVTRMDSRMDRLTPGSVSGWTGLIPPSAARRGFCSRALRPLRLKKSELEPGWER